MPIIRKRKISVLLVELIWKTSTEATTMIFNIFSDYMSTKKSKKFRGYLSATSYGGFQSPLTHLYLMSGNKMNRELKNNYLSSCWE